MRRLALIFLSSMTLVGCGLTYSRLPEIWDQTDPDATYHMEVQVKQAIYCELKKAAADIKSLRPITRETNSGHNIATAEDQWFPDSWGVLVQLTIQAEEKSSLTPGVTFKTPMHNAPVNFPGETIGATGALAAVTYGPLSVPQSFGLGFGGQLSSDNMRSDKYNTYYSAQQLNVQSVPGGAGPCRDDVFDGDPRTSSSPFVDASNLGIREWLKAAVRVINFERSSRVKENGEGPPIQATGAASDSSTYDNKFIIVTDANIAPNWNLVRISTPSTPLFDASRTRTHELIMTVGPGANSFKLSTTGQRILSVEPSTGAANAFNAALIGSAVSNALRAQLQ